MKYLVMFLIMTPTGLEIERTVNAPTEKWCMWYRDVYKQILIDDDKEGDVLCLSKAED